MLLAQICEIYNLQARKSRHLGWVVGGELLYTPATLRGHPSLRFERDAFCEEKLGLHKTLQGLAYFWLTMRNEKKGD